MDLSVALAFAAVLYIVSTLDWRTSVKAVLLLVILEGAMRKWMFPEASDLIYFIKDIVLLGAYARYFVLDHARRPVTGFSGLKSVCWFTTWIICIQVFNLRLNSVAAGVFGLKVYLWYVPLCFMLRDLFRSSLELQRFLIGYLLVLIPICGLGIVQFFSPPTSPINTYVATSAVATFGELNRPRITGTFSYITGYTAYLYVCLALLIPMLTLPLRRAWFIILLIELTLLTVNVLMTGSRGPVMAGAMFLGAFFFFTRMAARHRERSALVKLVLASGVCLVFNLYWFDDAIDAFWHRAQSSHDIPGRVKSTFVEPLQVVSSAGIAGYGAGATHPGVAALRERMNLPDPSLTPPGAEDETVRVLLELGAIGFIMWYSLRLYLIWALWHTWRSIESPYLKQLALAAFLVHAIQFPNQLVLNATFGIYFWVLAGFIFLLPQLDSMEALQAELDWSSSQTLSIQSNRD